MVNPGDFFSCFIDIPRGSHLDATISITDDVTNPGAIEEQLGPVKVPGQLVVMTNETKVEEKKIIFKALTEHLRISNLKPPQTAEYWREIPGGITPYASYKSGITTDTSVVSLAVADKGLVLMDTYFGAMGNISQVEFVPTDDGFLTIEVVTPQCPAGTFWCPEVRLCHEQCQSELGTASVEENCGGGGNSFCSNQDTCSDDLTCPIYNDDGDIFPDPVSPEGFKIHQNTPSDLRNIAVALGELYKKKARKRERERDLWIIIYQDRELKSNE